MYTKRKTLNKCDLYIFIFFLESGGHSDYLTNAGFKTKFKIIRQTYSLFFIPKDNIFYVQ